MCIPYIIKQADPVMVPARIPRVRRSSPDAPLSSSSCMEADYCISLRIWDVLLWFAIMQRPRRDVGICSDFANTLAEYSVQLLPRSIFPYDLVPMTRLDPIERTQVGNQGIEKLLYCTPKQSVPFFMTWVWQWNYSWIYYIYYTILSVFAFAGTHGDSVRCR
jgi:hypothetical protein